MPYRVSLAFGRAEGRNDHLDYELWLLPRAGDGRGLVLWKTI